MKEFKRNIVDEHGNDNIMLFERITGSRLYGTSFEKGEHPFWDDYISDWDYRGLYMVNPEIKIMLPPFNKYEKTMKLPEDDIEYYELEKFYLEAIKNNPNYMDLIFGDEESLIGTSEKGRLLIDNRDLFLSNKLGGSFNGFAQSQLTRMKNHKKWFTQYPDIYDVHNKIKEAFENKHIDYDTIATRFSGALASKISDVDQNSKKEKSNMPFDKMIEHYFKNVNYDIKKYMKPTIYEYLHVYKDGHQMKMTDELIYFLHNGSTFKKKNESLYFIYQGEDSVLMSPFAIRETLKHKPDLSKAFLYLMHVDYSTFKSNTENIKDLWSWKVERNGRRSDLEERFGYDVKHAMHVYRLLDGAIETFEEGTYTPRLSGNRLLEAKSILAGELTYDEVIAQSKVKMLKLKKLASKGIFPDFPDNKKLNDIYMSIILDK